MGTNPQANNQNNKQNFLQMCSATETYQSIPGTCSISSVYQNDCHATRIHHFAPKHDLRELII